MAEYPILITTLDDVSNSGDGVLSLRESLACAIACAQAAPQESEPIVIAFSADLFKTDEAVVTLQSALELPAGALGGRKLILSAPEGKSVTIVAPAGAESWCDANDNTIEFANVAVFSAAPLMTAMPLFVTAVNVEHLFVNPDYPEAELDATHFRTIADAVNAYPDYTGTITVEKPDAATTIGALTTSGKIFGGAMVTGGTSTADSALTVAVGAAESAGFRLLMGGCYVDNTSGSLVPLTGDFSLTIGGAGTIVSDFAFGGIFLSSGKASVSGSSTLSISSGTFNSVVCGGHVAGGTSTVLYATETSSCTLTISGGVFLKEVAAGNYNQAGTIVGRHVTHTLTITGGTFYKSVYGGNIARTQALARAVNYESPIDMTVNSRVYVTIDASSPIQLLKNVVLGSRYQGKIAGSTQMTFSGIAENLTFDASSLVVGDSESANSDEPRINGNRVLCFDSYRSSGSGAGDFSPLDLFGFNKISFSGESHVGFAGSGVNDTGFDLSTVKYWSFEYGSSLDWSYGDNDFYADSLAIVLNGQSVTSPWTFFTGSDNTLYRWDKMGLNANYPVTIDGVTATWNKTNKCFVTSEYKIYREGNSLKLATLA